MTATVFEKKCWTIWSTCFVAGSPPPPALVRVDSAGGGARSIGPPALTAATGWGPRSRSRSWCAAEREGAVGAGGDDERKREFEWGCDAGWIGRGGERDDGLELYRLCVQDMHWSREAKEAGDRAERPEERTCGRLSREVGVGSRDAIGEGRSVLSAP